MLDERERALFRAMLDDPNEPAHRWILADALLERGERFGELLLPADSKRLRARQKKQRDRLSRAFYAGVADHLDDVAWHNGLLDQARLLRTVPDGLSTELRLSTVRKLSVDHVLPAHVAFLETAWLPWLEVLRIQGGALVKPASNHRAPRVEVAYATPAALARMGDPDWCPALRALYIRRVERSNVAHLIDAGVHERPLDTLEFAIPGRWEAWCVALSTCAAERLVFHAQDWRFEANRSWEWTLRPTRKWSSRKDANRALTALPRGLRVSVRFEDA